MPQLHIDGAHLFAESKNLIHQMIVTSTSIIDGSDKAESLRNTEVVCRNLLKESIRLSTPLIDGSVFYEKSVKRGEHCRNCLITLRKMPLQTLEEEKKFKIPT